MRHVPVQVVKDVQIVRCESTAYIPTGQFPLGTTYTTTVRTINHEIVNPKHVIMKNRKREILGPRRSRW